MHKSARSYRQICQIRPVVVFRHAGHVQTSAIFRRSKAFLHLFTEFGREPVETLSETVASQRTARLNFPLMVLNLVEAVDLRQFFRATRRRHISLVCKDEDDGVFELVVHEHGQEFCFRGLNLRVVPAVDHENHSVRVRIVSIPCGSQVFLTAQVPHLQPQVLVLHFLDVAADSGLGDDDLVEGQLVQDCCLACIVHADDDDFELHVAPAESTQTIPDRG